MKKQSNNIADYPDADLLFPGKYIKSAEIKIAGRPIPITIVRIEPRHELHRKGASNELKPALFFKETEKGFVLNKTNAGRLVEAFGKDPRKWIGKKIVLCVERVDGFGKKTDGIRVDLDATIRANNSAPASEPQQQNQWDDLAPQEPDEAELARLAAEAEAQS